MKSHGVQLYVASDIMSPLWQSLVICEDCADLLGQAVCLQHLGNVFKMQKDNFLALEFFERCLEV